MGILWQSLDHSATIYFLQSISIRWVPEISLKSDWKILLINPHYWTANCKNSFILILIYRLCLLTLFRKEHHHSSFFILYCYFVVTYQRQLTVKWFLEALSCTWKCLSIIFIWNIITAIDMPYPNPEAYCLKVITDRQNDSVIYHNVVIFIH